MYSAGLRGHLKASLNDKANGTKFKVGTYVWGKMNKKYWPAMVISPKDVNFKRTSTSKSWVFWFGDYRVSELKDVDIVDFHDEFAKIYATHSKVMPRKWKSGVYETVRLGGSEATRFLSNRELIEWMQSSESRAFGKSHFPSFVRDKLELIKSENADNEDHDDDKVRVKEKANFEIKEQIEYCLSTNDVSSLRFCLACYSVDSEYEHPIFFGLICQNCMTTFKQTFYRAVGGKKSFCTICACSGNALKCTNKDCRFVYCRQCVDDFYLDASKENFSQMENWFCFVCTENCRKLNGVIKVRGDWKIRISKLFESTNVSNTPPKVDPNRSIRVLSLFDGIGSGLTALNKLGVKVETYYSCELNGDCNVVVKRNYGNKVHFLGDVANLTDEYIKSILPIDLLLFGFPNYEASVLNPYRMTYRDSDAIGRPFFHFNRVNGTLFLYNERPYFWLFSHNGSAITVQRKVSISRFLRCEPKVVDVKNPYGENENHLVWSNVPKCDESSFSLNEANDENENVDGNGDEIASMLVKLGFPGDYMDVPEISNFHKKRVLLRSLSVNFVSDCLKGIKP